MKKIPWVFGIICLTLIWGCGAGNQFVDGMAAILGQGGKIAREDVFDKTIEQANKINKNQPSTKWETRIPAEGSDFISFINEDQVLVGTVESGSYLGVPKHGDIRLFNAKTGAPVWSAKREGLKNGHYVLLTTEPVIVIVGRNKKWTKFLAYDPKTGSKKWQYKVKIPDQFIITEDLGRVISFSSTGSHRKIEAIDIKSGTIIWSQKIPEEMVSTNTREVLLLGKESVFVVGKKIVKLADKDGKVLWSKYHPILSAKDRAVNYTSSGIMVYHSSAMAIFREKDGAKRWERSLKKTVIRSAAVLNKRIYSVVTRKSKPGKSSLNRIQAASIKNGKRAWTKQIKGTVTSPLYLEKGVLTFTTDSAIYGLNAGTGKQLFCNPFSKQFKSGSPNTAKTLKRPDIIQFRSKSLYLVRELSGICAYAFPSGKKLWEQETFKYQNRTYSADRLYTVLAMNLIPDKPEQKSGSAFISKSGSSSNSQNMFIKSAQQRYESERQRTASVLENKYATKGDRKSAHQSRAMNASLMEANLRVSMAMGQLQEVGGLFETIVGLQGSIEKAINTAAIQGVITRKYLELRNLMGLSQTCFQGKYFLWPFDNKGRGVTIVDLDTGKRNDLIFSPHVAPLTIFGLDMPTFCIGPNGTLVMVGVGLNPEKYESYVKWKYRMPKPSVLAYDMPTFDFLKTSLTQKRAEQEALEEKKKAQAVAKSIQAYYDKTKIHTATQMGNLKLVKTILDSGTDANLKHPNDECGPLIFAIIGGHTDIVKLLIKKGADVNDKTKEGRSALFWAKHFKNKEIVNILKQAGAQ